MLKVNCAAERKNCNVNDNVSFHHKLKDTCTKSLDIALYNMDNCVQNTMFTLLQDLIGMLKVCDFGTDRHKGRMNTPVADCLRVLLLGSKSAIIQPGFSQIRSSVSQEGDNPSLQCGHKSSTTSKLKRNQCDFCCGIGVY